VRLTPASLATSEIETSSLSVATGQL
jgi:hypothetical protein